MPRVLNLYFYFLFDQMSTYNRVPTLLAAIEHIHGTSMADAM